MARSFCVGLSGEELEDEDGGGDPAPHSGFCGDGSRWATDEQVPEPPPTGASHAFITGRVAPGVPLHLLLCLCSPQRFKGSLRMLGNAAISEG